MGGRMGWDLAVVDGDDFRWFGDGERMGCGSGGRGGH